MRGLITTKQKRPGSNTGVGQNIGVADHTHTSYDIVYTMYIPPHTHKQLILDYFVFQVQFYNPPPPHHG